MTERPASPDAATVLSRGRSVSLWPALVLGVVCLIEFVLFDHFGSHRVTPIYPRWNDQIQYLSECYTGYEFARVHGILSGLWHTLVNPSAQGTLHDFAALIVFQFSGPSRSAALGLNMLALIAWQAALYLAVGRRSGSRALGFAAAMLPLVLRGPWEDVPGSAYDFRLDHFAMCALGVTSAMAMLTQRFHSRRWSVGLGVATGITLLTRFLTGTYLVVIFVAFFAWAATHRDRGRRMANLIIGAVAAVVVAGPILWLNREWVWNYYYVGHYVGPESAIRNQNFGLGPSLRFVFGWLADRHLGVFFGVFAVVVAGGFAVTRYVVTRRVSRSNQPWHGDPVPRDMSPADAAATIDASKDAAIVGLVFLFAPALVLTLHPQKSEVVLGALVPGVVLLVAAFWTALARAGERGDRRIGDATAGENACRYVVSIAAVLAALVYFGQRQLRALESRAEVAELRQVNTMADFILAHSEAAKLERPRVAVDYVTDAFDAQVLRVICYERHHVWIDFDMRLPTGIAEPEASLVRERIADSDFVFLLQDDSPGGPFPFDRKLAALRPELRAWCEAHLHVAKRFTFGGHGITLYERASL